MPGEQVPGFWMYETSGVLRPVIEAYLRGDALSPGQIGIMRQYLRQWIAAPAWWGPEVEKLRASVDGISSRPDIAQWLYQALNEGIDPL